MLLEDWAFVDGFFMTVITISTVGYGITGELSQTGQWFTSLLIFMSIVCMTCWTATLTSFIVEGDLGGAHLRRRMMKTIAKLKDHTIVCGSGQMAQAVVDRLTRHEVSVVVLGDDQEQLDVLRRRYRNLLIVEGNPTNELALADANILAAKHVVAAMDSEMDNLLVAITCKDMGHEIQVIARSNNLSIGNRMRKAGVDEVISPSQLSGDRVAELILS
jgi:voltage-gated potassium channel